MSDLQDIFGGPGQNPKATAEADGASAGGEAPPPSPPIASDPQEQAPRPFHGTPARIEGLINGCCPNCGSKVHHFAKACKACNWAPGSALQTKSEGAAAAGAGTADAQAEPVPPAIPARARAYEPLRDFKMAIGISFREFKVGGVITDPTLIDQMLREACPIRQLHTDAFVCDCPRCGHQFVTEVRHAADARPKKLGPPAS